MERNNIKVLVIDNYDSFVYTLAGYLKEFGVNVEVIRNDTIEVKDFDWKLPEYDGILISPGPGTAAEAGISVETILWAGKHKKPLFGVCLGHQALAEAYGGKIIHAPEPFHGKTSSIQHTGKGIFTGLPTPLTVARYHSLVVDDEVVPKELAITAVTGDGIIMALEHRKLPLVSVQFHPESILTEQGYHMVARWLEDLGLRGAQKQAVHMFSHKVLANW